MQKVTKKTGKVQHNKGADFSYISEETRAGTSADGETQKARPCHSTEHSKTTTMILRSVFFLACIISASAAAQTTAGVPETDVVATVGPRTILARDVLERIDLMPWPGKDRPSLRDSVSMQATLSLVAEKLLSLEASATGIGLNGAAADRFASLERAFARDELFRQEIDGKISIRRDEAALALRRFGLQLRLAVFSVPNEPTAELLARILNTPAAPRSVSLMPVTIVRQDTVTVSLGELAPAHEDAAYALSHPLEARTSFTPASGWLVLQLLGRRSNSAAAMLSRSDQVIAVEKLLRKRKQAELTAAFYEKFTGGITTHMDSVLFLSLADSLLAIMRTHPDVHRKGRAFSVLESDIVHLSRLFRSVRGSPFVIHGRDTASLGQIIEGIAFYPVQMRSLETGYFREDFNRAMIDVAESELIAGRALQLHYNDHPDVRRDLGIWIEAWQTQEMVRRSLDSADFPGLQGVAGPGSRAQTRAATQHEKLDRLIRALATRYGVSIDFAKVRQLVFTPYNMFTRRMIGFGGTLPAVPLLPHLWEWYTAGPTPSAPPP